MAVCKTRYYVEKDDMLHEDIFDHKNKDDSEKKMQIFDIIISLEEKMSFTCWSTSLTALTAISCNLSEFHDSIVVRVKACDTT